MYRRYRIPSVWHDMDRMQREMNRLFDGYTPMRLRRAPAYPAMNVWANENGLKVTAEVPGVDPQDVVGVAARLAVDVHPAARRIPDDHVLHRGTMP